MTAAKRIPAELPATLRARIAAHIRVTDSGCWEWTGTRSPAGYARIYFYGKSWPVHRVLYTIDVGPIPEGLQIDHLCRNPPCVNPDHLEPVTGRVNLLRGNTLAAIGAAKTHCPRGHEYSPENTHIRPSGRRTCRRCDADRMMANYYRRKTA